MTKDPRSFKTPSNQPSLGDRLVPDGKITSDTTTVLSCWTSHFEMLFLSQIDSNSSLNDIQKDLPHFEFLSRLNFDDIIDDNFTAEEIEESIRKLKENKAGGIDGLPPKHLEYGGPLLILWLKQIFCAFGQFEQVPLSFLTA